MDFVQIQRHQEHHCVQEGDLVIMSERFDHFIPIYCKAGAVFQNRFGQFHHDDIIGHSVGRKLYARKPPGKWVRVLAPSSNLWTNSLKHRTQIVQELDQSIVVFMLGLRPGMIVLESGTGSGAMSTSIMRSISPNGHLHTAEFNQVRANAAREDFEKNQLSHLVTVHHADICAKPSCPQLHNFIEPLIDQIDALFLDVPNPWEAIATARRVLKANHVIACYSPCFEQVSRTCEALRKHGFHSLETVEARQQLYEPRHIKLPVSDFGSPVHKRYRAEPEGEDQSLRPAHEGQQDPQPGIAHMDTADEAEGQGRERGMSIPEQVSGTLTVQREDETLGKQPRRRSKRKRRNDADVPTMLVTQPQTPMRGHTAFLTFATAGLVLPEYSRRKPGGQAQEDITSPETFMDQVVEQPEQALEQRSQAAISNKS